MSKAETVVWAVAWLATLAGTYAYCLHRFEPGRKVIFGQTSSQAASVRFSRIPVPWLAALYVLFVVGFVMAAMLWIPSWIKDAYTVTPDILLVVVVLVSAFVVLGVVARLHNRGASQWPKPGWYDDANDAELMRWWNGIEWTQYTYPRDRYAPDPFADTSA